MLDTETTTLDIAHSGYNIDKQAFALKKPLVYDIGWTIIDRQGNIAKKVNYLVQEIYFNDDIFASAYYADKKPLYQKALLNGSIQAKKWDDIIAELQTDLEMVHSVCAYNASFDFKRAIPYTERYIKAWYGEKFKTWEKTQFENHVNKVKYSGDNSEFKMPIFRLRDNTYPIIDIWAVACEKLLNNKRYKKFCIENGFIGSRYFKTSAEIAYRYLNQDLNFIEAHTALNDAIIESEILVKALKKGKIEPTIKFMPCSMLGTVAKFKKGA